jgi:hypothetical protein
VSPEKKSARSSYVVRTDQVVASNKPHFYGEKVRLSDEEAKPLLTEGKVSKE